MKFVNFNGVDNLFDTIAETRIEAFNAMQEWHAELRPGDKVLVLYSEFPIFQEVLEEPAETREASRKFPQYMWVRAYSLPCPEGEVSSVCRCNAVCNLTEEEWAVFKEAGWLIDETTWGKFELETRIRYLARKRP
jgi:hypothetical protein